MKFNKETLLSAGMNNLLSLVLGLPALLFVLYALPTPTVSDFAGFVGFAIIGAVY
jgi:hypothetical protein